MRLYKRNNKLNNTILAALLLFVFQGFYFAGKSHIVKKQGVYHDERYGLLAKCDLEKSSSHDKESLQAFLGDGDFDSYFILPAAQQGLSFPGGGVASLSRREGASSNKKLLFILYSSLKLDC